MGLSWIAFPLEDASGTFKVLQSGSLDNLIQNLFTACSQWLSWDWQPYVQYYVNIDAVPSYQY